MNSLFPLIGLLAGICTTLAFVPQVVKTWRSHSADDISLGWLAIFSSGTLLWLVYGLWLADVAISAANGMTLLLVLVILYVKLRTLRAGAMPGA
jgi:MtN3 and saliva related transmembrane protein